MLSWTPDAVLCGVRLKIGLMKNLPYYKYISSLSVAAFILAFLSHASALYAKDSGDGLTRLKGADPVYYGLYLDNLEKDRDAAMKYAELFLAGLDSNAVSHEAAEMADRLSDYLSFEKFRFSEAIRWRNMSLRMYTALKDFKSKAETDFELALLYLELEKYNRTLFHTAEARSYFEKSGNVPDLLECYNLLGIVYNICRDDAKSKEYFNKYIEGARNAGDSDRMVNALHNYVVAYPEDTVRNTLLLDESVQLCEKTRDTSKLTKLHLSIASMYVNSGNVSKASEHLEQVYPMLKNIEDSGAFYMYRGMIDCMAGDSVKAISSTLKSLEYFRKGEFDSKQQYCLDLLQKLYSASGDYEQAYNAIKEYNEIREKHSPEQMFIELFKTENDLRQLTQEKEERHDRIVSAIWLFVALLLLSAVSFAVYRVLKRKSSRIRKREEELTSMNEKVELRRLQQYKTDRVTEEVIDKLNELSGEIKDPSTKMKINRICSSLLNSKDENEWKNVSRFVPEFNTVFFKKLLADYPDLTVNERRLCALLNLNLSTKEISEITRQSTHSINVARSRLRAKFNISGDTTSIQEFLSKYNSEENRE